MAKFLFVLTRGWEDPSRSTRSMQLANVARLEGHEVNIFLTDDGVIYAKPGAAENVIAPTGDEMQNFLEQLCQAKTPIYV